MSNVSFMVYGIKLWAEYKAHDYDDIEILAITVDKSETDISKLLTDEVNDIAYRACELDYLEVVECKKETALEMRYYDEQGQIWPFSS